MNFHIRTGIVGIAGPWTCGEKAMHTVRISHKTLGDLVVSPPLDIRIFERTHHLSPSLFAMLTLPNANNFLPCILQSVLFLQRRGTGNLCNFDLHTLHLQPTPTE